MKQKALEKEKDRQGKRKYEADRRRVLYERKRLEVIKEKRRKLLALDERDENGKIVIRLGHNNSKSHTNSTQS